MTLLQSGITKSGAAYTIDQSVRFEDANTSYMHRTPGSASNRKTWTFSTWTKRVDLASEYIFSMVAGYNDAGWFTFEWAADGTIAIVPGYDYNQYKTAEVYRDFGAWYHLCLRCDTTQSSWDDRLRLYVNGELQTLVVSSSQSSGEPAQDAILGINDDAYHAIGKYQHGTKYLNGYLAETCLIDGTSLGPGSFAETDSATNQWKPVDVSSLTFGTNGFHLKYAGTVGIDSPTKLMLHMDGADGGTTFTDSSASAHSLTAYGNTHTSTDQKKFGTASGEFDGAGDTLAIPDNADWDFGTGDLTFDCWVRGNDFASPSARQTVIDIAGLWIHFETAGYMAAATSTSGAGTIFLGADDQSWSDDTWYHLAVVRSGDSWTLYQDGTSIATATETGTFDSSAQGLIANKHITTPYGETYWDGFIDEFRISKGVARWTANFTPPTSEYETANSLFGVDSSGNGNDFTATNLVATDQMVDSPTNNFCTLNPLIKAQGAVAYSEGNLQSLATAAWNGIVGTAGVSSGKWYWEQVVVTQYYSEHGIVGDNATLWFDGGLNPQTGTGQILYGYNGKKNIDNTETLYGDTFTSDDIIGVALNMDDSEVTFYKNNVAQDSGTPISFAGEIVNASLVMPCSNQTGGGANPINEYHFNAGQDSSFAGALTAQGNADSNGVGDFYYAPPTDYLALCTSNLSDPSIKLPGENFNTIIWTGTSGARDFTGVGFQPDLVWDKSRDDTVQYNLLDSIRGAGKTLASNTDNPDQDDYGYGYIDSFDTDGFSTTTGEYNNYSYNKSGDTYVAWNWLAAASNAANAIGSLSSVVRANTTAGFSIVTYTGTGSLATVGHGLSAAPELVIIKNRTTTARSWAVGTTAGVDFTYVAYLNATNAFATDSAYFNDTDPSASVFTINTNNYVNNSGDDYVAYCFHSVEGYSKVGSYEGNGSTDGPFLYCGFRPAFLLTKETSGTGNWRIKDDKRDTYNVMEDTLYPNSSTAELDENDLDFVSNGVKLRNSGGEENADGDDYIFMAFAESPFKYANAR